MESAPTRLQRSTEFLRKNWRQRGSAGTASAPRGLPGWRAACQPARGQPQANREQSGAAEQRDPRDVSHRPAGTAGGRTTLSQRPSAVVLLFSIRGSLRATGKRDQQQSRVPYHPAHSCTRRPWTLTGPREEPTRAAAGCAPGGGTAQHGRHPRQPRRPAGPDGPSSARCAGLLPRTSRSAAAGAGAGLSRGGPRLSSHSRRGPVSPHASDIPFVSRAPPPAELRRRGSPRSVLQRSGQHSPPAELRLRPPRDPRSLSRVLARREKQPRPTGRDSALTAQVSA